ncbi:MAG: alanyl-tRNA synthetase [Sphingobacteriales bacterium]|nr:MAG: alanyl-tRNA synthetase [Sphingobacteriales bacterium]
MEPVAEKQKSKGLKKWLKRFGIAGFWFFLIKGLLWIVVFIAGYYGFKLW